MARSMFQWTIPVNENITQITVFFPLQKKIVLPNLHT